MDTDWSIAAAKHDPVVIVPWADGAFRYVDLRGDPPSVDRIAEAQVWPEVRAALLVLNAPVSPVWTAKCDAWVLDEDERQLDFGPVASGFGSYFDVLSRDRRRFADLSALRSLAERWAEQARIEAPQDARAGFVIRPAEWDGAAGFAVTVYVFGYGADEARARADWRHATETITAMIAQPDDEGGAGR